MRRRSPKRACTSAARRTDARRLASSGWTIKAARRSQSVNMNWLVWPGLAHYQMLDAATCKRAVVLYAVWNDWRRSGAPAQRPARRHMARGTVVHARSIVAHAHALNACCPSPTRHRVRMLLVGLQRTPPTSRPACKQFNTSHARCSHARARAPFDTGFIVRNCAPPWRRQLLLVVWVACWWQCRANCAF